eukprot:9489855-Pyramimonas_sp.AAC.1
MIDKFIDVSVLPENSKCPRCTVVPCRKRRCYLLGYGGIAASSIANVVTRSRTFPLLGRALCGRRSGVANLLQEPLCKKNEFWNGRLTSVNATPSIVNYVDLGGMQFYQRRP